MHPFVVGLFKEDEFCRSMEDYRQYLINCAFHHVEKEYGVVLERKAKLVKTTWYTDPDGGCPREFLSKDDGGPVEPKKEPVLVEEVLPKAERAMKKGFLQKTEGKLYPNGSPEGVLPENAGDPMGWIPKKLREKCNIVDTSKPEYKAMEEAQKGHKEKTEFAKQVTTDLDQWSTKRVNAEKWAEDRPCGKYDLNYARFDAIESEDEKEQVDECKTKTPPKMPEVEKAMDSLKKGFLKDKKVNKPPVYRLNDDAGVVNLEVDVPGLKSMRDVDLEVTSSTW